MARMDRVSIRLESSVRKNIRRWAAREGLPPAELCRRLLEWAADQYSLVGEEPRPSDGRPWGLPGLRKLSAEALRIVEARLDVAKAQAARQRKGKR